MLSNKACSGKLQDRKRKKREQKMEVQKSERDLNEDETRELISITE
jgi:hypothetical protein